MKRKILSLLLAACMVVSIVPAYATENIGEEGSVSGLELMCIAAEEANEEVTEEVTDEMTGSVDESIDNYYFYTYEGENGEIMLGEEKIPESEDELLGRTYSVTFGTTSMKGYSYFKKGEYQYFYNASGTTIKTSNVYVNGVYQYKNRSWSKNTSGTYHNNVSYDCVCYYKYDAINHTLLTTWAAAKDWKFYDVFPSVVDWMYEGVKYCYDNKIMKGTKENQFDPDEALTRGMFVTVIYRMEKEPSTTFEQLFTDVYSGKWFDKAVVWANKKGIVDGFAGTTLFKPNDSVTREQVAKMLYTYAKYKGYNVSQKGDMSQFVDWQKVQTSWGSEYMQWAIGANIIGGKKINGFSYVDPKGKATRAECATMIRRFLNTYTKK